MDKCDTNGVVLDKCETCNGTGKVWITVEGIGRVDVPCEDCRPEEYEEEEG